MSMDVSMTIHWLNHLQQIGEQFLNEIEAELQLRAITSERISPTRLIATFFGVPLLARVELTMGSKQGRLVTYLWDPRHDCVKQQLSVYAFNSEGLASLPNGRQTELRDAAGDLIPACLEALEHDHVVLAP